MSSLIPINFAGEGELQQLPGVGLRIARHIVQYREENFPITLANIEQIPRLKPSEKLYKLINFTTDPECQRATPQVDQSPTKDPSVPAQEDTHIGLSGTRPKQLEPRPESVDSFVQTMSQHIDAAQGRGRSFGHPPH